MWFKVWLCVILFMTQCSTQQYPSKKSWREITRNKPVNLEDYIGSSNERVEDFGKLQDKGSPNIALLSITKPNKIENKERNDCTSTEDYLEGHSTDYEILKHDFLRSNYGDCISASKKLCRKALKKAMVQGCSGKSCKSKVKTKFTKTASIQCAAVFDNTNLLRVLNDYDNFKREATSEKAEKLLSIISRIQRIRKVPQGFPTEVRANHNLYYRPKSRPNILRDKYERACRKSNAELCKKACLETLKVTCESTKCPKKMDKNTKKTCPMECKQVFKVSGGSGSDSSDDSSNTNSDSD